MEEFKPIVAIVQARMGSTRLPGKVLMKVKGKTMLAYLIERLKKSTMLDRIVVATSMDPRDDVVVSEALFRGAHTYRGSELNVLERYYFAAKENDAKTVVRITADCPLNDPELLDRDLKAYFAAGVDYLGNKLFPIGIGFEVFSFAALEQDYLQHETAHEEEHVTPFIYNHPEKFRLDWLKSEQDYSKMRITVDTPEDFEFVKRVIEGCPDPELTLPSILKYLEEHRELLKINAHIKQKT